MNVKTLAFISIIFSISIANFTEAITVKNNSPYQISVSFYATYRDKRMGNTDGLQIPPGAEKDLTQAIARVKKTIKKEIKEDFILTINILKLGSGSYKHIECAQMLFKQTSDKYKDYRFTFKDDNCVRNTTVRTEL